MENVDIAREAVAKDPNAGSAEIAKKIMAESKPLESIWMSGR